MPFPTSGRSVKMQPSFSLLFSSFLLVSGDELFKNLEDVVLNDTASSFDHLKDGFCAGRPLEEVAKEEIRKLAGKLIGYAEDGLEMMNVTAIFNDDGMEVAAECEREGKTVDFLFNSTIFVGKRPSVRLIGKKREDGHFEAGFDTPFLSFQGDSRGCVTKLALGNLELASDDLLCVDSISKRPKQVLEAFEEAVAEMSGGIHKATGIVKDFMSQTTKVTEEITSNVEMVKTEIERIPTQILDKLNDEISKFEGQLKDSFENTSRQLAELAENEINKAIEDIRQKFENFDVIAAVKEQMGL